ncbi:MAG: hypothetical protein E7470_05410 [Ruminococcaceae bacterium]|nr:hypothetical protein [Oscillospiraceae bacterium]
MRDIPIFTTEYGVASLVLREIPYRQEAYICIHSSCQPKELLDECVAFCRSCGAEKIYARGHKIAEEYPLHTAIVKMRGIAQIDENKVACLFPVTEDTIASWRQFLNERLRNVDNAGTLASQGEAEILQSGGAYFVHHGGTLLGAGWLKDGELLLIAAIPGEGERVLHTLLSIQKEQPVQLEVASTNVRAIRLYERFGMIRMEEIRRWYKIFPLDK